MAYIHVLMVFFAVTCSSLCVAEHASAGCGHSSDGEGRHTVAHPVRSVHLTEWL